MLWLPTGRAGRGARWGYRRRRHGPGGGDGGGKPAFRAKGLDGGRRPAALQYTAPTVDGEGGVESRAEVVDGDGDERANPFPNASLNGPCPCGSGKKYKRCHGAARRGATA